VHSLTIPLSPAHPVTDVLHGVPVTDPYRWLEGQDSEETRSWVEAQTRYARGYLDGIPGREMIRDRVRSLLDVGTYDSFLVCGSRYFFRKRLPGAEQPCLYMREGAEGDDQLLVDPAARGTGPHTAIKPLRVSPDGSLLLYEVKQGGERTGTFEILDVRTRNPLTDSLPHGYLRGFAFAPDSKRFYYVSEGTQSERPYYRAVWQHVLGTNPSADKEIFYAGDDAKLRLVLVSSARSLGFLVYRFLDKIYTDFHIWRMGSSAPAVPILREAEFHFSPRLVPGRILAVVDQAAPNRRIVDVQSRRDQKPLFFDLVPESDATISDWAVTANHILVSYARGNRTEVAIFDCFGKRQGEIPFSETATVRFAVTNPQNDEILLERESFTHPIEIIRSSLPSDTRTTWAKRRLPFDPDRFGHEEVAYPAKDGTSIRMSLLGRRDLLVSGTHPVVMTSYGGFGVSVTPQFSVFLACLAERGCLIALPNIRGGSESGARWHQAAKRRRRQVAFDDFLAAAVWLVETGRTTPEKLAICGSSNSGLLVAAAMTQRPDLFSAVLCMVPLLDMLRYHTSPGTEPWKEEYGTSEEAEDFKALFDYSPYHAVRDQTPYPATMIVSGDADQNCHPWHARKMTARLQAASSSGRVVLLDYQRFRGHSPVLPLSDRVEALTDRLAFLSRELGLADCGRKPCRCSS
jgi:prolyl oligopeptidase